ncbi:universal stress protein [Hamadaea sp. NPDC050747]|uniref:universal stress protein n=1 Tax=Hamadaea sp. NPDC050747 TaxID=3155789 RepID=UPI0033FA1269
MTNAKQHVVVGVDGSPSSVQALRWAADYAAATGADLVAVTAWQVPSGMGSGAAVLPGEDFENAAWEVVDKALATAAVAPTTRIVERGDPATVLLDHAKDADLLVVGSRGHGEVSEVLLGSVSHRCVHHATCPVVVVRAPQSQHGN